MPPVSNSDPMAHPFFTIGHSTRPASEFVDLLKNALVELVADVRTVPRSRTNPQYACEVLAETLARSGIGYEHIAPLGGLRAKSKDVSSDVNAFWQNQSFHNYADYAMTPAFRTGLARLRKLGHATPCAIMCAEAVWWQCHRRIITDYLVAAGEAVFHILGENQIAEAHLTREARHAADGALTYPAGDLPRNHAG